MSVPTPGLFAVGILATAFADTLSAAERDHFAASIKRTAHAFLKQGADSEEATKALAEEAEWTIRLARELILSPPTS